MLDRFKGRAWGFDAPTSAAFAVTPADGVELQETTRGLYIGGAGDVQLTMQSGDNVLFEGLLGGTILPVRAIRVASTGTTATSILGLV